MNDVLKLKAKHFKGTQFGSNSDCAMAKAAREQFNVTGAINASSTYLHLNDAIFFKVEYTYSQFKEDKAIAESKKYGDDVVRSLKLGGE